MRLEQWRPPGRRPPTVRSIPGRRKTFAGLVSKIQAIDGFISMDDFQSQTRPQPGEF
jgi:hypothetical protein